MPKYFRSFSNKCSFLSMSLTQNRSLFERFDCISLIEHKNVWEKSFRLQQLKRGIVIVTDSVIAIKRSNDFPTENGSGSQSPKNEFKMYTNNSKIHCNTIIGLVIRLHTACTKCCKYFRYRENETFALRVLCYYNRAIKAYSER